MSPLGTLKGTLKNSYPIMNDPSSPGKGMGKTMLTIGWIIALIMLTLFFSAQEENQFNPNTHLTNSGDSENIEITLERNRYNHYVASGKINNQPAIFMLDTGATDVVIPANLSRKYRLEKGAQNSVQTANGRVKVWRTRIDQLELGPITLKNVRASINPGMQGNEILLGMSALKHLEFTQSGNFLTIKQHK